MSGHADQPARAAPQVRCPPRPPDWLAPLLSHCHLTTYPKQAMLIRPEEPATSLYYLVEGTAVALLQDEDGRELILAYLHRGEFIGEMGLFAPQPTRSAFVRTQTECRIAEIGYARLTHLLEAELRDHALAILFAIGRQLTVRLQRTSRKAGDLAFLDVTGRIAATLLELCRQPEALTHPAGMQIRITRQELGRIVGCSREMAGRVLKNLEEQHLISVSGKTIVVFNTR